MYKLFQILFFTGTSLISENKIKGPHAVKQWVSGHFLHPKQKDGYNCGIFCLQVMNYLWLHTRLEENRLMDFL